MPNIYSKDVRQLVLSHYLDGMSRKELMEMFKVGYDTITRWVRQHKQTGDVSPKERSRYKTTKVNDEDLLNYLTEHPSATLEQIGAAFGVSRGLVEYRFKLLGITRKKSTLYKERDEAKRHEFLAEIAEYSADQLVYVDESGIHEFM